MTCGSEAAAITIAAAATAIVFSINPYCSSSSGFSLTGEGEKGKGEEGEGEDGEGGI